MLGSDRKKGLVLVVEIMRAVPCTPHADTDFATTGQAYNAELGVQWFFAPHADIRVDGGYGMVLYNSTDAGVYGLVQGHFYL